MTSHAPIATASPAVDLIPVFGVLAAVVLLGEHLARVQLLGAALVVAGLGAAAAGISATRPA